MAQMSEPKSENPQLEWPTTKESYSFDQTNCGEIGKGSFGKVFVALCKPLKTEVAIKVIELEAQDESTMDEDNPDLILEVQKEAQIMHSLQHENIVTCYTSFVVESELWIVMPFLAGGSCADLMRQATQFQEGFKDENILATILKDVLSGVEYCHKDGRIHRDVKARNILLSEGGVALLADFGVSGALVEGGLRKRGRKTLTGTPCWMAPEVMSQQRYNHRADIWSVGITALELAFGKAPYENLQPFKVMMQVMDNEPPTVDDCGKNDFSRAFKSFVGKCLQKDANKRATAKELLGSSFFKKAQKHEYIVTNVLKFGTAVKTKPGAPKSVSGTKILIRSAGAPGNAQSEIAEKDHDSTEFRWSATFSEPDVPQQKGRFMVEPVEDGSEDDT